jgi:pyruvate dehydrogenase E1 component alpha subunit
MYRRMLRIRRFDEAVQKMAKRGDLPGSVHLSLGQEAQVVGSCMPLANGDFITGTHRSHGHPIGKGAPLDRLMAELMGKRTGVCKGKGGSMHLADFSIGSLGESGVIGSGIPIVTGAGLAAKTLRTGAVALCFFGDGGANQGVLYECLNMAALWKLPVIFLCENNFYASLTPQNEVTAHPDVYRRAEGFGVPGVVVKGQDALMVYAVVSTAVERARRGQGPTFVEVRTYRYSDHSEGIRFAKAYAAASRNPDEVEQWRAEDPLAIMRQHLADHGIPREGIADIDDSVQAEVEAAIQFARESPFPEPAEAFEDVYSTPIPIAR